MNITGTITLFLAILSGTSYGTEDIVIGSIGVVLKKVGIVNTRISDQHHMFEIDLPIMKDVPFLLCTNGSIMNCMKEDGTPKVMTNAIRTMEQDMAYSIDILQNYVKRSFKLTSNSVRKRREAPLSFIRKLSSSIFGTASLDDLRRVTRKVNEILRRERLQAEAMDSLEDNFASLINVSNSRNESLKSLLNDTRNLIIDYSRTTQMLHKYIFSTNERMALMFMMDNVTQGFKRHINEIIDAITNLKQGYLSHILLPDNDIKYALDSAVQGVNNNDNTVSLLHRNVNFYRKKSSYVVVVSKDGTKLWITLQIPVSTLVPDTLYKVRTFQVPIHDDVEHGMVIKHLPDFVLLRETTSILQHAAVSHSEIYSSCVRSGSGSLECDINLTFSSIESPTCLSGLLKDNASLIESNCKFVAVNNSIKEDIIKVSKDSVIMIRMTETKWDCFNVQRTMKGCSFCEVKIPCNCRLKHLNYSLYASTGNSCSRKRDVRITRRHLFNLIVLRRFAGHLIDDSLKASETYYKSQYRKALAHVNISKKFYGRSNVLRTKEVMEKATRNVKIFQSVWDQLIQGDIQVAVTRLSNLDILLIIDAVLLILCAIVFLIGQLFLRRKYSEHITNRNA